MRTLALNINPGFVMSAMLLRFGLPLRLVGRLFVAEEVPLLYLRRCGRDSFDVRAGRGMLAVQTRLLLGDHGYRNLLLG